MNWSFARGKEKAVGGVEAGQAFYLLEETDATGDQLVSAVGAVTPIAAFASMSSRAITRAVAQGG